MDIGKTNERLTEKAAIDLQVVVNEATEWIEAVTGKKILQEFRAGLEDGTLLCELINEIKPGSVKKINRKNITIAHLDNLKQFLTACESIGLKDSQLFDVTDLQAPSTLRTRSGGVKHTTADRRLRNVCITLYWLGRKVIQLPDYNGPQLNLDAFREILDIPNNSSYFLQGYETSSSSSNHKGHYPHTSSSSIRLPNASEVGNVVEPNMQQKENGLTQNQELTADELLANIQSAVDELLLDYQPSPQPEILPEKNTMMTKVQEKFTSETTHKNEAFPVSPVPSSHTQPSSLISLDIVIKCESGSLGLQIIGGADIAIPAQVEVVIPGNPAEISGLLPGDLLVSVEGQDVSHLSHLELISLIKQFATRGQLSLGVVRKLVPGESLQPFQRSESRILWEEEHEERERQRQEVALLYGGQPNNGVSIDNKEEEEEEEEEEEVEEEEEEEEEEERESWEEEFGAKIQWQTPGPSDNINELEGLGNMLATKLHPSYDATAIGQVIPYNESEENNGLFGDDMNDDGDTTPEISDGEMENEDERIGNEDKEEISKTVYPQAPISGMHNKQEEIDPFAPLNVQNSRSSPLLSEVLSAHTSYTENIPNSIVVNNGVPSPPPSLQYTSQTRSTPPLRSIIPPLRSIPPTRSTPLRSTPPAPKPTHEQNTTKTLNGSKVEIIKLTDEVEEIHGVKVRGIQRTRWTPDRNTNRKVTSDSTDGDSPFERHEVVMTENRGRAWTYHGQQDDQPTQGSRPHSGQPMRPKQASCSRCRSPIIHGPMMSIPARQLNFHSKCLLCVVCRSPLTLGYGHTTVFLRHSLPHCASCYSTDNGIKATTC